MAALNHSPPSTAEVGPANVAVEVRASGQRKPAWPAFMRAGFAACLILTVTAAAMRFAVPGTLPRQLPLGAPPQKAPAAKEAVAVPSNAPVDTRAQALVRTLCARIAEDERSKFPAASKGQIELLTDAGKEMEALCEKQRDPQVLLEAGSHFRKLGLFQVHVARFEEALATLTRARQFLDKAAAAPDSGLNAAILLECSDVDHCFAAAYWHLRRQGEAFAAAEQAIGQVRRAQETDDTPACRGRLIEAVRLRGLLRGPAGDADFHEMNRLRQRDGSTRKSTADRLVDCIDECAHLIDMGHVLWHHDPSQALVYFQRAGEFSDVMDRELAELAVDWRSLPRPPGRSLMALPPARQLQWLNAQSRALQGSVHEGLGNVEQAQSCYQHAIGLLEPLAAEFPDVFWTRSALFEARAHLAVVTTDDSCADRWQEALDVYDQLPRGKGFITDFNAVAWWICLSKCANQFSSSAIDMATRSCELEPTHRPRWWTLGVALYRAERYPEAIEILSESPPGHMSSPELFFLAMAFQRQGDSTAAQKLFSDAERHPQNWSASIWQLRAEAARLIAP